MSGKRGWAEMELLWKDLWRQLGDILTGEEGRSPDNSGAKPEVWVSRAGHRAG